MPDERESMIGWEKQFRGKYIVRFDTTQHRLMCSGRLVQAKEEVK